MPPLDIALITMAAFAALASRDMISAEVEAWVAARHRREDLEEAAALRTSAAHHEG